MHSVPRMCVCRGRGLGVLDFKCSIQKDFLPEGVCDLPI